MNTALIVGLLAIGFCLGVIFVGILNYSAIVRREQIIEEAKRLIREKGWNNGSLWDWGQRRQHNLFV